MALLNHVGQLVAQEPSTVGCVRRVEPFAEDDVLTDGVRVRVESARRVVCSWAGVYPYRTEVEPESLLHASADGVVQRRAHPHAVETFVRRRSWQAGGGARPIADAECRVGFSCASRRHLIASAVRLVLERIIRTSRIPFALYHGKRRSTARVTACRLTSDVW
ncbi:hypothetical protein BOO86_01365 [Mycobacterium sp. CBMA 234]|nr:hypothetical protein [Mycolicibacterium sp. CBMA 234]